MFLYIIILIHPSLISNTSWKLLVKYLSIGCNHSGAHLRELIRFFGRHPHVSTVSVGRRAARIVAALPNCRSFRISSPGRRFREARLVVFVLEVCSCIPRMCSGYMICLYVYIYIIYIIIYFQLHYFIQLYAFCCCTINRIAVKDYRIYLQLDRCAPPNPMCFLPLCLSDLGRILDHAFLSWYVSFVLPFDYVFLLASFHPFDSESVLGKVIHQST